MGNVIWLGALVLLAFATKEKGWAPGDGPFDLEPEGVASKPLSVEQVYAASGRRFKVSSYARGSEQIYHVAQLTGTRDWISFLVDTKTGARVLFRAHAKDDAALAALRKDFAL